MAIDNKFVNISGIEADEPRRNNEFRNVALGIIATITIGGIAALAGIGLLARNERENSKQLTELRDMPTVEYVVQEGDSLFGIGERFIKPEHRQNYNDYNTLKIIEEKNPGKIGKDYIIRAGETLNLPREQYDEAK